MLPQVPLTHTIPPEQIWRYDAHNELRMVKSRPQRANIRCVASPKAIRNSTRLEKEGTFLEVGVNRFHGEDVRLDYATSDSSSFPPLVTLSMGEKEM